MKRPSPLAASAAGQGIHPARPRSRQRCGATSFGQPTCLYAAARSSGADDPEQAAGIGRGFADTVSRTIVTTAVTGTGSRWNPGMGNAAQVRRLRSACIRPAADPTDLISLCATDSLLRKSPGGG